MMDNFSRADLRRLISEEAEPAVSMLLPMRRAGRDTNENPIRLKNAINEAIEKLVERGLRRPAARDMLQTVREMQHDEVYHQYQSDALVIFCTRENTHAYRVPLDVDPKVVVGRRFYVRPMLRLLEGDGEFYILAVSQNRVRLLRGSHYNVSELDSEGLPKDLRTALNIDEFISSLQVHQAGMRNNFDAAGIFHGHGASDMDVKKQDELLQYFRQIDRALQNFFESEHVPLVFAGVDYLFPLFQKATNYKSLVPEPLRGNPDRLSAEQLHEGAWNIVTSRFEQERENLLRNFGTAASRELASSELNDVLRAARIGQVDTLFLAEREYAWGQLIESNGDQQDVEIQILDAKHPAAEDLLNIAVVQTLINQGRVFTLPKERMPNGQPAAAIFRYQLTTAAGAE